MYMYNVYPQKYYLGSKLLELLQLYPDTHACGPINSGR
jgi:hypothetical protein